MKKVIVIVGPTGVGKTKASISLAKIFNGEIINADSTQIYRGLDIATAKVTEEEKEGIPHHLFDIKDITEDYTVYDYQKDARKIVEKIISEGKIPILVGGTGLYIKACLYDYKFTESNINNTYEDTPLEVLYQKLLDCDPTTVIHKNNRKRIVRALNYFEETGMPFSSKGKNDQLIYDAIIIGLTTNRDLLYERINNRVEQMMNNGLLEESKKIYDSNIRTKAVLTPIGYKELFGYFDGKDNLKECLENIKQNSRKYAKRQYTWFNNQMKVVWFEVNFNDFNKTIEEIVDYIKQKDVKIQP